MSAFFTELPLIGLIICLIVALLLLGKSADYLVDAVTELARNMGISELIVGTTILSVSTTIPEIATAFASAFDDAPEIALGNLFGATVTNLTLIIGVGALFGTIAIKRRVIRSFQVLFFFLFLILLYSYVTLLPNFPIADGVLPKWLGVLLFLSLIGYLWRTIRNTQESGELDQKEVHEEVETHQHGRGTITLLLIVAGMSVIIAFSASVLVQSVHVLGIKFQIPETLISGSIVALGTSLPELSTFIMGVRKKKIDLVIGNIIGSNILNLLLILPITITFSPNAVTLPVEYFYFIFPILLGTMIFFHFFIHNNKKRQITRREGVALLGLYVFYLVFLFILELS